MFRSSWSRWQAATGVLSFLLIVAGCEGPQGPAGAGVDDFDLVPPSITLTYPPTGLIVDTDTFTVAAAASDNDQVVYVEFFLDASSDLGGLGRAVDSFPPYRMVWNLDSSGHGPGLHLLVARAVDPSHNMTDTPTTWISRAPFNRLTVLYYDGFGDLGALAIPDEYGDRFFNVRFSPADTCRLLQVFFEFTDPTQLSDPFQGGCDIDVYVWDSTPVKQPGEELARIRYVENDLLYDQWMVVDVQDLDLVFSGDFHAGFSPDEDLYDFYFVNQRAVPILLNADPSPLPNATNHRSMEYEGGPDGRGWGSIQAQWNYKWDFHIRVLVDYFNGPTVLLSPEDLIPAAAPRNEVRHLQRQTGKKQQ